MPYLVNLLEINNQRQDDTGKKKAKDREGEDDLPPNFISPGGDDDCNQAGGEKNGDVEKKI